MRKTGRRRLAAADYSLPGSCAEEGDGRRTGPIQTKIDAKDIRKRRRGIIQFRETAPYPIFRRLTSPPAPPQR